MLWAASCLCFFGFLPSEEVVCPSEKVYDPEWHLCWNDVRTDSHQSPSCLEVTLKGSKIDLFRQGCTGATGMSICPVAAVLAYIAVSGKEPGPLFVWESGKFLTRVAFVNSLRDALSTAGLVSSDYAGHSFRMGAATTDNQQKLIACKMHSLRPLVAGKAPPIRYIRTSPETLCKVPKALLSSS